MGIYVQEEAQPLMQAATGSLRSMAPALAQLFESRMRAGVSRKPASRAKQPAAAAEAAQDPALPEADADRTLQLDAAGPSKVSEAGYKSPGMLLTSPTWQDPVRVADICSLQLLDWSAVRLFTLPIRSSTVTNIFS